MLKNIYLSNTLSMYSEIISKLPILMTNKPPFTCIYVSCTHIENVTFWCVLVQTNLVFDEFSFSGPGFQILFQW